MICGTPAPLNHRRPSTFSAACLWCGRAFLSLLATLSAGLPTVFAAVTVVVLVSLFPATVEGQGNPEPCSGGGYDPTPVEVALTAVPIEVASTTDDYFVLYVRHDLDADTVVDLPVAVTLGGAGTTMLAENVEALSRERYRVEKYLVADPADVDGDCIDDITELADTVGMNPVNPAPAIAFSDGAVSIPDRGTFETLSYRGAYIDPNLIGIEVVKFVLVGPGYVHADLPRVYFQNTETHRVHHLFMETVGISHVEPLLRHFGSIVYYPRMVAPDGGLGVYSVWLSPSSCSFVNLSYTALAASMPLLEDNLVFYVPSHALPNYQRELACYEESRINLVFDADISSDTGYLALNPGEGYGRLRVMEPGERPHSRDLVIYEALPNELPRVAGIISTVPQTPLSHVNLRAVQGGIPNAFIRDALDNDDITALLGSYVRYEVTESGWELRAATRAQVDAHYAASRPVREQTPQRDLSVTAITPLSQIGFEDWKAFGVKAANLAVLRALGFPRGTVPNGFAVPFYFYDEFMKTNGFYDRIETMLADAAFQTDFAAQEDSLKKLRKAIKDADTPAWITAALTAMHATYPEGQSLRYRSSTNNEDLPGFNGAGLYDSKTQHPEETEEDGIAKSLKQVYASLWNFRAFTERDFHRIDHRAAAMGVLVHPNYSDELANGVAVSFNPLWGDGTYYVNTQLGEDLVTNPEAHSVPEELLLYENGAYFVLATSNLVPPGQLLMSDVQLLQLRVLLEGIHEHFETLYDPAPGEPFEMEIEFQGHERQYPGDQAGPSPGSSAPPPPQEEATVPGEAAVVVAVVLEAAACAKRCRTRPAICWRDGTDGAVTLTWDVPEDDGGAAITDYQYGINGRGWTSIGSTLTTHTVSGLVNDAVYVFQVAGGEPDRQEPGFPASRGHAEGGGGSGLCAFRQRDRNHLRDGARECGPAPAPVSDLLLRSRGAISLPPTRWWISREIWRSPRTEA